MLSLQISPNYLFQIVPVFLYFKVILKTGSPKHIFTVPMKD